MIFDPAELDERTQRALTKHFAAGRGDRVPVAVQDIADLASVVVVIVFSSRVGGARRRCAQL